MCALIKGEQVAFEMVQVIDQEKIGRRRGNQNLLDSHFEQIHRSLALKSQDRPPKKRILIKLQPSSSLRSRMSLATKIIEQLMLAGPNLEGELLLSPDLKKLASVKVGREKRLSPFFDLSLPTHYNAVPLAAVDNKFEKSYITRFPMELLGYYDAQDVPPESETKRLYALLDDRLSQSSFRRAWVFDFRQHRVCYQTMLSETDVT